MDASTYYELFTESDSAYKLGDKMRPNMFKVDKDDGTRHKTSAFPCYQLQKLFTANLDRVQKNGLHYHSLVLMLNLSL